MSLRQRISAIFRRGPAGAGRPSPGANRQDSEFAVIGLGVFGRNLALRLSELGFTVLGIDSSSEVVQSLADDLSAALVLDATNEDALRQADIESYGTVIVAIGGNHFEAAALATITLAKLGIPRILAVASTPRQADILGAIGAGRVLHPVEQSAIALADELVDPGRGNAWSIAPDDQVAFVPVPAKLVDHPLSDCERHEVRVLLVVRDGRVLERPDGTFLLMSDDELLIHGAPLRVLDFRRLV